MMTTYFNNLSALLSGVLITAILTIASVGLGLMLAICMTIGSESDNRFVRKFIDGLGFFFRGTPLLVQLFLIYYGAGQFEWIRQSFLWPLLRAPMTCAI